MKNQQPVPVSRRESEASRLLRPNSTQGISPVVEFEVSPKGQCHVSLGDFAADKSPIGFSIEVTPDHEPEDVTAQITKLGAEYNEYELVLHVANRSHETVSVEVQQL